MKLAKRREAQERWLSHHATQFDGVIGSKRQRVDEDRRLAGTQRDESIDLAEELLVDGILDMLLSLPSGKAMGEDCPSGKAMGEDCIQNEVLRRGGRPLVASMSSMCAKAYVCAEAPSHGREAPW